MRDFDQSVWTKLLKWIDSNPTSEKKIQTLKNELVEVKQREKMNQINLAKLFLVISVAAMVISTIEADADANPQLFRQRRRSLKHPSPKEDSDAPCPCPRILWPVCGSNGSVQKTYDNECIFRCAASKSKTPMKIVKQAACDQEEDVHVEEVDEVKGLEPFLS